VAGRFCFHYGSILDAIGEETMPTLTLRNLPAEVHHRLKARALRHRRSLNSEAIECLKAATITSAVDVEALLARARTLREQVRGRLTASRLSEARRLGRP
jgi:plasmid stability protein